MSFTVGPWSGSLKLSSCPQGRYGGSELVQAPCLPPKAAMRRLGHGYGVAADGGALGGTSDAYMSRATRQVPSG
jgi:hypothetical protein